MVPLTRHGWRELLIGSVVLALLGVGLGFVTPLLALVVLPALIFLFAFFRDPHRPVPTEQHAVVSPADGVVSDITQIDDDPDIGGPAVRIGIFLSVFNVHVNRSPCDGTGCWRCGTRPASSSTPCGTTRRPTRTSRTPIVLGEPDTGRKMAVVKQIVGLIARRIVCTARLGDTLRRGERFGMIKFGSRTELTLAGWLEPEVRVKVGQAVRGGSDVLAVLKHGIHTTVPATAVRRATSRSPWSVE